MHLYENTVPYIIKLVRFTVSIWLFHIFEKVIFENDFSREHNEPSGYGPAIVNNWCFVLYFPKCSCFHIFKNAIITTTTMRRVWLIIKPFARQFAIFGPLCGETERERERELFILLVLPRYFFKHMIVCTVNFTVDLVKPTCTVRFIML